MRSWRWGGIAVLAVTAFLALVGYYHGLINQYTTQQPAVLAEATAKPEEVDALNAW